MLARLFTRLFWAAVFFALGVWASPRLPGLNGILDRSFAEAKTRAVALWEWSEDNLTPGGRLRVAAPAPSASSAPPPSPPAPVRVEKPVAAAPVAPPPPTTPKPTAAAETASVEAARAAAARGDVAGAVRVYEAVLVDRPNDAAAAGELGNVLWSNGRTKDAAAAYHRAALALIAGGRAAEARALVDPVRRGDPSLADDLERRLARAGTP
ncbi:MAG: tetratricopeptide repeat protein [Hyphomicrobiales bacterium]|nr:tetratricopeptide repeat protein [Hyphomicrobiales bacterium]